MYEERWQVKILTDILEVVDPNQAIQRIRFKDIQGIAIETNDSGPFGTDVIWYLSDGGSTISFPMGATGETGAMNTLQTLDGFDNQELINAMGCTDNQIFILLNRIKA